LKSLLRESEVTEWFQKTYPVPTPAQKEAWPKIEAGKNVLIVSPTGTGKTFAAFLAVLSELALLSAERKLRNSIYAIYVSPLRALSYDLEKNLNEPLRQVYGENAPIRVGLRTGDTSSAERQRQFLKPPHILLTTPESLMVLLTQKKWLDHLQNVRWMIVDEIHALAENKRGAHLSLSLERLDWLVQRAGADAGAQPRPLQRIGLSATVAPLSEVAQFLVGAGKPCEIVDVSTAKKIDLRVFSPLHKNPYPESGYTGARLIPELARLVTQNRTTVIFTNTRSGAEAATYWLHKALPKLWLQIECHHASLDRDVRQEVEDRLKRGELRAVVCSTSLELGIDIGSVDLVVMLSTPKGVSKALQRTGRAGHNIHAVSRGLLMATNMNDLVECCATALLARSRQLDSIRLPNAPLDVLAQHLASMGCTHRWGVEEAFQFVQRAYPYRGLSRKDYNDVLDYLAGGGKALRQQYKDVFGKIVLDEEGFETRSDPRVRRDLLQNIGVIPNEGMVLVRLKRQNLGLIEEMFIRQLKPGDVFILSGRPVRLDKVGLMECFVSRAENSIPTVPRWNANKMPLTNKVAEEIVKFRDEINQRIKASPEETTHWVSKRLACGMVNARIIYRIYAAQHRLSEIPTCESLLVEDYLSTGSEEAATVGPAEKPRVVKARTRFQITAARHYFFHSLIGRKANDALSRVVALRLSRMRGGNAVATPDDYGFVLTVTPTQAFTLQEIPALLSPEKFEEDLTESLSRSHLLKYHFRNAAQTGLMVYRNFFGEQKSVRKLQWSSEVIFNVLQQHEPDHVLLREAHRDAMHSFLDMEGAIEFLHSLKSMAIHLRAIQQVPPLSFALFATKIKEALMVEDPRETMERLFHLWWSKIEENK
jgi:ATP-dependent Lhr-like helicase